MCLNFLLSYFGINFSMPRSLEEIGGVDEKLVNIVDMYMNLHRYSGSLEEGVEFMDKSSRVLY